MSQQQAPTLTATSSPMMAGLDRLLGNVEDQVTSLRAQGVDASRGGAVAAGLAAPAGTAPATPSLEDLTVFMVRLKQMKDWLQQDPRLLDIVDDCIKQHVQGMELRVSRQNFRLAVLSTIGGAILGWLLSALQTPGGVFHLLAH
jgi:hypothetical protein